MDSEPHASRIRGLALGLPGRPAGTSYFPGYRSGLAERGGVRTLDLSRRGGLAAPPAPPRGLAAPGGR